MNIFQSFLLGLKKGLLRAGKRILNLILQLLLITCVLIGMAITIPWLLIIWTIIASLIGGVVVVILGIKIDFLLLLLIQFLLTVFAVHLIGRKHGVWKELEAHTLLHF